MTRWICSLLARAGSTMTPTAAAISSRADGLSTSTNATSRRSPSYRTGTAWCRRAMLASKAATATESGISTERSIFLTASGLGDNAEHLLDARDSFERFLQTIFAQGLHAFNDGLLLDLFGRTVLERESSHL